MIIYGSSLSPFVRKVLAFAGEKGIELELQPTGWCPDQPSAEYLAASPFRKMPALRDGDYTLADSSAIVHYLEAKNPEPALIPADPEAARQDDLVRGICRHDPGRLRREDLLQPDRRAAFPRAVRATSRRRDAGRAQRPPANPRLSGEGGPRRRRLSRRRQADAGRHRGRGPVRQFPPHGHERRPGALSATVAYVERILARPSLAQWVERETALLARGAGIKKAPRSREERGAVRWTRFLKRAAASGADPDPPEPPPLPPPEPSPLSNSLASSSSRAPRPCLAKSEPPVACDDDASALEPDDPPSCR